MLHFGVYAQRKLLMMIYIIKLYFFRNTKLNKYMKPYTVHEYMSYMYIFLNIGYSYGSKPRVNSPHSNNSIYILYYTIYL